MPLLFFIGKSLSALYKVVSMPYALLKSSVSRIVMSKEETQRVLSAMNGTTQLMAKLLYGSGKKAECSGKAALHAPLEFPETTDAADEVDSLVRSRILDPQHRGKKVVLQDGHIQ